MCRMLLAVGKFEMKPLLDGFALMAADYNEKHEENEKVRFQHADGWGIAYLENDELKIFKSTRPCFDDPQLYDFEAMETSLVVLHARRASKGEVSFNNVHPFRYLKNEKTAAFFHNGTVYEDLPLDPHFEMSGSTDSEGLFYHILTRIDWNDLPGSYLNTVTSIQDYSSLNSVFCLSNQILLLNQFKINPLYYTMKMTRQPFSTIVSSEVLPTLSGLFWEKLQNHTLLDFQFSKNEWQMMRYQP